VLPVTAAMGRAMTVTAFVTVAPTQPTALVSVTVTSPLLAPNVTLIEFAVPPVKDAPLGTIQRYVEPALAVTSRYFQRNPRTPPNCTDR